MKKLFTLMLASTLLLSNSAIIFAEASDSTVTFKANTDPTDPVDPDNPDNPGPGPGPGTGSPGPLSIDYVPTLDFGTQSITGSVETYEATVLKPHIQFTDKRGTGEGYTIKASVSNFTADAGAKVLSNAVLNFKNPAFATTSGNTSPAPTTFSTTFALTSNAAPTPIVQAAVNQGMGTWVKKWYATNLAGTTNDNVTLTIDTAPAFAKAYTAVITWTIETTP